MGYSYMGLSQHIMKIQYVYYVSLFKIKKIPGTLWRKYTIYPLTPQVFWYDCSDLIDKSQFG